MDHFHHTKTILLRPRWQREHGVQFAVEQDLISLLQRYQFIDQSWRNDVCPVWRQYILKRRVIYEVWVDHPLLHCRVLGCDVPRYVLGAVISDEDESIISESVVLFACEDLAIFMTVLLSCAALFHYAPQVSL